MAWHSWRVPGRPRLRRAPPPRTQTRANRCFRAEGPSRSAPFRHANTCPLFPGAPLRIGRNMTKFNFKIYSYKMTKVYPSPPAFREGSRCPRRPARPSPSSLASPRTGCAPGRENLHFPELSQAESGTSAPGCGCERRRNSERGPVFTGEAQGPFSMLTPLSQRTPACPAPLLFSRSVPGASPAPAALLMFCDDPFLGLGAPPTGLPEGRHQARCC